MLYIFHPTVEICEVHDTCHVGLGKFNLSCCRVSGHWAVWVIMSVISELLSFGYIPENKLLLFGKTDFKNLFCVFFDAVF